MTITDYHAKFFAYELTKRCSSDSMEKLAGAVAGAQVDVEEFTPLTGKEVWPKRTAVWRYAEVTFKLHVAEKRMLWGNDNTNSVPAGPFLRVRCHLRYHATPERRSTRAVERQVRAEYTLLGLCIAFRIPKGRAERYPNLTVGKFPKQVLSRCEWGHDDYSLKVKSFPKAPPPAPTTAPAGQLELI